MGSDRRGTGRGCARHIRQLARPNPLRLMPPYALECNPRCMIANKWPKNLGQLFARFLTELLTEAGQLVGWTSRQAVI